MTTSLSCRVSILVVLTFCMPVPNRAAETESINQQSALPELVVTATRSEHDSFDIPQAVTLLDSLQIEQANIPATPDLFNFAEGVYIQKTNLGGGSAFVRGLTGKQVLILVDGVRLNNSFYRFGPHQYLNTIDPNIIQRIEVVRGPGSVLYGSDALGGVINLITKRRKDFLKSTNIGGRIQGIYDGSVEGGSARLQTEGNIRSFGWLGGVTGKHYDDLEGGGDIGEQVPSGYDEYDVDLKLNGWLDDHNELILTTQYTRQFDVPKTSEVTLGDKLKFNYEPQSRSLIVAEYRGEDIGFFDRIKVNVSYNRQEEGEDIVEQSAPTLEIQEVTDVKTIGATAQLTNQFGSRHKLTYGVEFYRDDYDTSKTEINLTTGQETALTPGTPDGAKYESLGVYLQDEIRVTEDVDAVLGVRYGDYETKGSIADQTLNLSTDKFTGSGHLRFGLSSQLNLVGGVSQGFRAPNMEDFFGRVDFFNEIPNTSLEPEESFNWELGFKYDNGQTTGDVYYYQSDYDGLIERVTVGTNTDDSPIKQRKNIKDARIRGVEAGLSHRFDPYWFVAMTFAWTEGEDRDTGEPLRRIPPLNGALRARYTANEKGWIELQTLLADRQDDLSQGDIDDPRIPDGGTPGYAVLNLQGAYHRTPKEQLLLTLQNLADKQYKTHGSGLYAPGRSVVVSYRVDFN